jgi:hypothetical protein
VDEVALRPIAAKAESMERLAELRLVLWVPAFDTKIICAMSELTFIFVVASAGILYRKR